MNDWAAYGRLTDCSTTGFAPPDLPAANRGRGEGPAGGERLEADRGHRARLAGDVVQPVGVGRYGADAEPRPHLRRRPPAAVPAWPDAGRGATPGGRRRAASARRPSRARARGRARVPACRASARLARGRRSRKFPPRRSLDSPANPPLVVCAAVDSVAAIRSRRRRVARDRRPARGPRRGRTRSRGSGRRRQSRASVRVNGDVLGNPLNETFRRAERRTPPGLLAD